MTQKPTHEQLLKQALKYFEQGFEVIPLCSNTKHPLISYTGNEKENIPATAADISNLWDKYPLANIGILARDFFVFDIDNNTLNTHSSNGRLSLVPLLNKYGNDFLKPTLSVVTPTNGVHLHYLKPKDFNLKTNIQDIVPGVDIIANNNAVVPVPPTYVDYQDKGQRIIGSYELNNKSVMTEPSSALINFINDYQNKSNDNNFNFTTNYQSFDNRNHGAHKWWSVLINGFTTDREATAHAMAGYLLSNYVNIPPKDAYKILKLTNERTIATSPLDEKELDHAFKTAFKERYGGNY